MREIAYTAFGRNTLVCGLISHTAAMLAGMTTAAGAELYFTILFPFSWVVLVVATYAEIKHRGFSPFEDGRFYGIAIVSILPVLGPLVVLTRLYRFENKGEESRGGLSGLLPAIFRLRANVLLLFVVIIVLFLIFAVIHSRQDPYFKRRAPRSLAPQSVFVAGQQESDFRTIKV
jgi:hypothetical protein